MLNSDTQEYIPLIQDFTKNFLFLCVIASTLFSFLFSSYGKFINLNAIIHFVRFTGFHSFTDSNIHLPILKKLDILRNLSLF